MSNICLLCGVKYIQRGPAGYGKCDDCFWEIVSAEILDAKEWAKTLEGIEYTKKYNEDHKNE